MVQIKQKSNKINITALITCFMLIMVFVFGCAQFAFASDDMTLEQYIEKYPVQYYVLTRSVLRTDFILGLVILKQRQGVFVLYLRRKVT